MVFAERAPSVVLDTGAERFLMDDEGMVIERLAKDGCAGLAASRGVDQGVPGPAGRSRSPPRAWPTRFCSLPRYPRGEDGALPR